MLAQLILRFFLGGAIVSLVAGIASVWEPKTFAGLFSAAPSVALATLALAFHQNGGAYAAIEGRSMALGSFALLAYCYACVVTTRQKGVPVWLGAAGAWGIWAAVAVAIAASLMEIP